LTELPLRWSALGRHHTYEIDLRDSPFSSMAISLCWSPPLLGVVSAAVGHATPRHRH
jgi:hypothetical protein